MNWIKQWGLPLVALVLLVVGSLLGLVVAPPDRYMGDVYRILYVHVPAAWMALVAYTVTLVASVVYLLGGGRAADNVAEASTEIGVLFNVLLVITGALWGRPTWGVYWSWDPRLTTAAIMLVGYAGYLVLRRLVYRPEQRATWAAVCAIILYVDIPLVWFSVKWWNSLHQVQSSPSTMGQMMVWALRVNAVAFLAIYLTFLLWRYRLGVKRQRFEWLDVPPPPPLSSGSGGAQ